MTLRGGGGKHAPGSPGGGGVTYIRRIAGGPGCCWAVCCEGGSKPPAAARGASLAVSRGAAAKEGAEGREGLGRTAGRVRAEAGSGGVAVCVEGGEVTRRRFCGAAGLVLGGDGPTWPVCCVS